MKRLLFFILPVMILASCTRYEVLPVYDERDRLIGYYEVEEYSRTYKEYIGYEIYVSKNPYSPREIYMDDFYAENTRVLAYVDYDRITIPLQISNGYEIKGSGYFNGRELHLDYRVTDLHDHSYTDYCEAIAYQY